MAATCAACGSPDLVPHLRVGGAAGGEDLVPTTDRYGVALSDIVRCRACGHRQLGDMPTEADLGEGYSQAASEEYAEEEAGQRETARRTLAAIERHVAPGALLDVGCWLGYLLAEAGTRGWETVGVEPSAFASARARDDLGLDVRTGDLFGVDLPDGAFDAVVLADVLEHLPEPDRALERVAELLAEGGVLYLALPDAGSAVARVLGRRWWSVIPTHVHLFTRGSLRTLLGRTGFEVVEATTAPKAFTVRYYLDRLRGYSPGAARALVAGARRVGVADRMWAPDFRDRMGVVARRVGSRAGR